MKGPSRDSRTPELPAWARWRPDVLTLSLHVQPGAKRSALQGEHGQRLKLALHAPPVDGKANEELLRFLGQLLQQRRSGMRLVSGLASREKTVAVDGDADGARAMCAALLALLPGPAGS